MRYLIDGYNLMHELGLMAPKFAHDGLRRARHRFLNEVAEALGPVDSAGSTVVFDAAKAPEQAPRNAHHKGLTVLFAAEDEDADGRIELLISRDSAPKALTVVSSDGRLRRAAARRGARAMSSDDFASMMQSRRNRRGKPPSEASQGQSDRPAPSAGESREWLQVFGDLDADLASPDAPGGIGGLGLSDADIARIAREVEDEFRRGPGRP